MLPDMSDTDMELLARYSRQHAEDDFAELVRRHLGLVFRGAAPGPLAATRRGSSPIRFIDLARSAE
jgi:hypothetical protein